MMKVITFSGMEARLRAPSNARTLFDAIRKKHVAATPEEKVRQGVIHYLIREKKFPRALLSVEASLKLNTLQKRCDILAYKNNQPVMVVECKAPSVKIDQSVIDQVARYNLALKVPYLLVTNGLLGLCCKLNLEKGSSIFLEEIPEYSQL